MNGDESKWRTKQFALRIIKLVDALPKTTKEKTIGNQLIRSGTSIVANYRTAYRDRIKMEFVSKNGIVIEEADESVFWLEIIIEAKLLKKYLVVSLLKEANKITAIMVSSSNTTRKKKPWLSILQSVFFIPYYICPSIA